MRAWNREKQEAFRRVVEGLVITFAVLLASATGTSLTIGCVAILCGSLIKMWARGFPKLDRSRQFEAVGPYRFVRHPYLLGNVLWVAGFVLASRDSILFGVALVVLAPVYVGWFRTQEHSLATRYGPAYVRYRNVVSPLLPQLIPIDLPSKATRRFRVRAALGGKGVTELRALTGGLLLIGVLLGLVMIPELKPLQPAVALATALYFITREVIDARRKLRMENI